LDTASKQLTEIDSPYTEISQVRCGSGYAAFIGGSPAEPESVIGLDTTTNSLQTLRASSEVDVDPGFVSRPEAISFPTSHGREAYALYYPPTNKNFAAPADELPPLRLLSHGGPTSATESSLNLGIQYWTSRGFAVLDVNYGGSSGYGREYRQRLNGQWGLVDVEDCCNGALYLAQRGLADRNRLTIRGGSAGGYTTLACLVFRNEVFRAGASYFGLADLERFVADTHKFESRYLSSLVGPYPEEKGIYFQRSPIHFVENLACPIILFQGDEDRIVPPSQSEMMFEAARSRGLPTAYLLFRGEQHGFRKSEDIKRSLEAELFFYSRIFGFEPADPIEPISIENL
jgi:dipeptidyl aminopeptidase/acylaminoacyl peptidase